MPQYDGVSLSGGQRTLFGGRPSSSQYDASYANGFKSTPNKDRRQINYDSNQLGAPFFTQQNQPMQNNIYQPTPSRVDFRTEQKDAEAPPPFSIDELADNTLNLDISVNDITQNPNNTSIYQTPPDTNASQIIPGTSRSEGLHLIPSVQRSRHNIAPRRDMTEMNNVDASGNQDLVFGHYAPSSHNWVTVFGFPLSKVSFVLKQFSHYGDVLDHRVGSGNWIHILYSTKLQADKALSKNGKIFDSILMVGVVECNDSSVTNVRNSRYRRDPSPDDEIQMSNKRRRDQLELNSEPTFETLDTLNRKKLRQDHTLRPDRGFWSRIV
ncbi:hypothetical protein AKO1_007723, partial [Acrasis kona]